MNDDYDLMLLAVWAKVSEFNYYINSGIAAHRLAVLNAAIMNGKHFKFFLSWEDATRSTRNLEQLRQLIRPEYLDLFDSAVCELTMRLT